MKSLAHQTAQALALPAVVNAASAAAQIWPNAVNPAVVPPTAALVVPVAASSALEQREFGITASGELTTVGNYTAIITLYAAVALPAAPLTAANWTIIGASTARAINTTTRSFLYRAQFICGSAAADQVLAGTFNCIINNLFDASAAITNTVAAVNLAGTAEPALYFAIGVTFSNANAGNIGKLSQFYLID